MNPDYKRSRIRRQDGFGQANINVLDAHVKRLCHKLCRHLIVLMLTLSAAGGPAFAASDSKPYDDRLMRLSEILGAIHYLRELCGANEGQYWRDRMNDLMNAEGSTALRRAKLTRAFNQGYRSYSRTYNTCSPSAQTAITRFLSEGSELSNGMLKAFPN